MSKAEVDHFNSQKEELDVLESIYLSDMEVLKATAPYKFSVLCKPFLSSSESSNEEFILKIIVEFTRRYPQESPRIEYLPISNINQNNIAEIENVSSKVIEAAAGNPLIFDIVENARVSAKPRFFLTILELDPLQPDRDGRTGGGEGRPRINSRQAQIRYLHAGDRWELYSLAAAVYEWDGGNQEIAET